VPFVGNSGLQTTSLHTFSTAKAGFLNATLSSIRTFEIVLESHPNRDDESAPSLRLP
jgi:hypothetical protein